MKKTLAVTVAVVFVLAFAAPVFAQSMDHNATYKMDGSIDLEKQVGHLCNTGAEMKQTIHGEGEMDKVMDTSQVQGVLTVSDEQDWVTAEDAVRNLTVTSVIELCAPPKTEFDATDYAYSTDVEGTPIDQWVWLVDWPASAWDGEELTTEEAIATWDQETVDEAVADGRLVLVDSGHPEKQGVGWGTFQSVDGEVVPPALGYQLGWEDAYEMDGTSYGSSDEMLAAYLDMSVAEMRATYNAAERAGLLEELGAHEGYTHYELDELTDQIWAVQVEADPGFSGNLHQDFEAAYGPYEGTLVDGPAPDFMGDEEDHEIHADAFGFRVDDDDYQVVVTGDDYVGNYFNIDQMARTSQGTVRRFIDVSSPWSHAYLYEDMEVVGMAEIEETFAMDNLEPGEEAVPEWWDLF